jgi:hypothetical protein
VLAHISKIFLSSKINDAEASIFFSFVGIGENISSVSRAIILSLTLMDGPLSLSSFLSPLSVLSISCIAAGHDCNSDPVIDGMRRM